MTTNVSEEFKIGYEAGKKQGEADLIEELKDNIQTRIMELDKSRDSLDVIRISELRFIIDWLNEGIVR